MYHILFDDWKMISQDFFDACNSPRCQNSRPWEYDREELPN